MADEIWLDVLPSMRGFGSDLIRQATKGAQTAGDRAGRAYSDSFNKSAGNTGEEQVRRLEAAQKSAAGLVSKISGEVSRARQAQQRSAADLLVAEQRLADAVKEYGEDSSQAQAASLRLEAARGKAADATQRFENAEDALREAHQANTEATKQLEKAQGTLNKTTEKAPGLWAKFKRGLGDTDAAASRTRTTLSKLASGAKVVGKGLAIGAGAVATFAATLTGMAIKGGIDRALNIEDARASLTGLGHDTKMVDKIMGSALASVKGTAFGLGDAATIAATAVAAGIKPGEDLTRTLKLTANTAALARTDLSEMGSILNKVWTSGRVSTEELNQLADRGIPIWTKLAESYGVSGTELRKMVSDGAVDAKRFADVLTGTVGTAADEMGKTTRGMWANFKAALGRGGEVIIKPFLDAFKVGLGAVIPLVDSFTTSMKPFMEKVAARLPGIMQEITGGFTAFGAAFAAADGDITSSGFPGFMERLGLVAAGVWDVLANKVVPALKATGEWVVRNKDWLAPLSVALISGALAWKAYDMAIGGVALAKAGLLRIIPAVIGGIKGVNAAMAANPIGVVITLVGALVGAFIYLWNTNENFRNFFINAWTAIKNAVTSAGQWIMGVLQTVGNWVTGTFGPAFTWLNTAIIQPVWAAIKGAVSTAGSAISGVLSKVGNFVKSVFGPVFSWLYNTIIKPIWGLIKWQIQFVSNVLLLTFDLIKFAVTKVMAPAFTWFYNAVIKPVWNNVKSFISVSWTVIKGIFNAVNSAVKNTLGAIFVWFRDKVITPVWNGIKTATSLWWTGVKAIFTSVRNWVRDTLGPIFKWFRDKIITPVWDGISSKISKVWNVGIKPIFTALGGFIKDHVVPAFKSGVKAIGSAWEVLKKAAGTPVYFVLETVYNKGIKATFDKVSKAIGSKATLPAASTKNIPHFAKGGEMKHGWKLVGEEGPELINTGPGYVYTAKETKRMLAGKEQAPLGVLDSLREDGLGEAEHAGMGGFGDTIFGGLKKAASWVGEKVKKGLDWVRGGLAKAAGFLLNPVKDLVTNNIDGSSALGGIVRKVATNAIDGMLSWIRGKDEEFPAEAGFEGGFTGSNGGFYRPVGGRITSLFGSSRGRYPHAGTDLAVPVGTAVRAAWNGIVKKAGCNIVAGRSGIGMLLGHAGGKSTYYGHLSKALLKPGTEVKAGQTIARSGNTGRSSGPHLHFETWQGKVPYNNIGLLNRGGGGSGKKAALYDAGGILPPGVTLTNNASGKPETVYTHAQSQALQTLANRGAQSTFPSVVTLVLEDGQEFRAYVGDVADGRMRSAKREARRENRQLAGR